MPRKQTSPWLAVLASFSSTFHHFGLFQLIGAVFLLQQLRLVWVGHYRATKSILYHALRMKKRKEEEYVREEKK